MNEKTGRKSYNSRWQIVYFDDKKQTQGQFDILCTVFRKYLMLNHDPTCHSIQNLFLSQKFIFRI